jgi:NitT/TauT family transport system permease protein
MSVAADYGVPTALDSAANVDDFRAQAARRRRRDLMLKLGLGFGFPLLLLLLWQALSNTGVMDRRFFPAPFTILVSARDLLLDPDDRAGLLTDVGITLWRVLIGYVVGSLSGIVLGTVMALNLPVRYAFAPLVGITYPTPKLAIFPLLIVVMGIGDASKIVLVGLGAFFMTCMNSFTGVRFTNPIHHDLAKAFRIPAWTRWMRVILPGALPSIVTGLKLALGQALTLVVSVEMVSSQDGLGHFIWQSWQILDIPRMFLGLVVVALFGGFAVLFGDFIERLLTPWARN